MGNAVAEGWGWGGQEGSPWNIVLSSEPALPLGLFSLHSSL